ncbi:MAG: hypothetical protein WCF20_10200 [Methylovirgula sp.]
MTEFKNPFVDRADVLAWVEIYFRCDNGEEEKFLSAGQKLLNGIDLRHNFYEIYRWKLQSFFKWLFRRLSGFLAQLSDHQIEEAIATARLATRDMPNSVIDALKTLDCLPGVGIPVASAILASMHPDQFTVIDRRAYRALGATFRDRIPEGEYFQYSSFCACWANEFKVTLRQYDQALWAKGAPRSSRSRKCVDPEGPIHS